MFDRIHLAALLIAVPLAAHAVQMPPRRFDPEANILCIAIYGPTPAQSSYAEVPEKNAVVCYHLAPLVYGDAFEHIARDPDWRSDTVWVGCQRKEYP